MCKLQNTITQTSKAVFLKDEYIFQGLRKMVPVREQLYLVQRTCNVSTASLWDIYDWQMSPKSILHMVAQLAADAALVD